MADNSDWYAAALARASRPAAPAPTPPAPIPPGQQAYATAAAPAAPAQAPAVPPGYMLVPVTTPPGVWVPPTPGGYAAVAPAGTPTQPGQPAPPPAGYYSYDANTGAQIPDDGHVAMLINAATSGRLPSASSDMGPCPGCGGDRYMARLYAENGALLRTPPAPQCMDCNYPAVQSGTGIKGLKAKDTGQVRHARQLASNHRVTVMDGSRAVTYQPPT